MDGADQSSFDVATKIRCLMDMAMKSEISWTILESLFDELTPSLEKLKQVVKVLLKEFQALQKKVSIFDSNAFFKLVYKATFVVVHPLSPSLSILLLTLGAKMSTKEHPFLFYYTKR